MKQSSVLSITSSTNFTQWLSDRVVSLAFTTYEAGKIRTSSLFYPGYLRGCGFTVN